MKKFTLNCNCANDGHQLVLRQWEETEEMYSTVFESGRSLPFFTRVKYAFMYLFKGWDLNHIDLVFEKKDIKRLKKFLSTIK